MYSTSGSFCQFLSIPVLMHGGLLCIAFCLSVCPVSLDQNSKPGSNLFHKQHSSWHLYLKGKDGVRQPRTLFALDCYLLGRLSIDLNQIGQGGSCRAGSTPREVGISKFQTVAMEIWISFYDGATYIFI